MKESTVAFEEHALEGGFPIAAGWPAASGGGWLSRPVGLAVELARDAYRRWCASTDLRQGSGAMSTAAVEITATQRSTEAQSLLATMLSRHLGRPCAIRATDYRPSTSRSTFALEEIDALLDNGDLLRLVLKTVGPQGLLANARMAKPLFLHDPLREIELYQHVLRERPRLGTATVYSTVVEPSRDRFWLLLERAPGLELHRVAELEGWRMAARWLGRMHVELAPLAAVPTAPGIARLLRYDADLLRMWIVRALTMVRVQNPSLPAHLRQAMEHLASRYDRVIDRLMAMPQGIIHGEFYASNILLKRDAGSPRICALDWEMAAIGPRLIDLAALVAGEDDSGRRHELALAYRSVLPPDDPCRGDARGFLQDLACCRLHLAVQWLGWSPDSSPPAWRAHDWLDDACRLTEELDL